MAKSITFSVKLNVNGKEELVAATADVKNLRDAVKSGAEVPATAAKVAIRGLMVASGVGVAIVALTMVIENLRKSMATFFNANKATENQ